MVEGVTQPLTPSRPCDWLIIGAAGLVGSHLRAAAAGRRLVSTFHRTPATDAVPLDLTDRDAVARTIETLRPALVVLAAAEAYVERCEREPEPTRRVNVDGVRWVVDSARRVDALVVFFSSEYVFDGAKHSYVEDDLVRPINKYGRQKADRVHSFPRGNSVPAHTRGRRCQRASTKSRRGSRAAAAAC